jgi:hypothetical protein
MAVKDFDYFMDHRSVITEDIDPIIGNLLTAMTGQKWKGKSQNILKNLQTFLMFFVQ